MQEISGFLLKRDKKREDFVISFSAFATKLVKLAYESFLFFINRQTFTKDGVIEKKETTISNTINWGFNNSSYICSEVALFIILTFCPMAAMINVPGSIPMTVAKKAILNFTPKMAGAKLTIQNGKKGKTRKKSMYLN